MTVHGWRPYIVRPRIDDPQALGLCDLYGNELSNKFSPSATCAVPIEHEVPGLDCTCGYEGFRVWPGWGDVVGHVTCVHPTPDADSKAPLVVDDVILHEEGWRARQYRVDYFVLPKPDDNPLVDMSTTIMAIVNKLKIPVIPYDHPDGCNRCLDASKDMMLGPDWKQAYRRNVVPAWVKDSV